MLYNGMGCIYIYIYINYAIFFGNFDLSWEIFDLGREDFTLKAFYSMVFFRGRKRERGFEWSLVKLLRLFFHWSAGMLYIAFHRFSNGSDAGDVELGARILTYVESELREMCMPRRVEVTSFVVFTMNYCKKEGLSRKLLLVS